jgi:hypothetical protein
MGHCHSPCKWSWIMDHATPIVLDHELKTIAILIVNDHQLRAIAGSHYMMIKLQATPALCPIEPCVICLWHSISTM